MEEVKGACRNPQNEEFHDLYCSPIITQVNKSRSTKWVGHVARMGRRAMRTGFRWGNWKEKRPLGRPKRRCEDIEMDLKETG